MHHRHKLLLSAFCGVVLVIIVVIVVSVLSTKESSNEERFTKIDNILPKHLDSTLCPKSFGNPRPVLIVSLDGFRADYLDRGLSPTIERLSERGVSAPYMKSVYPTKTFPNHYSIVTGVYPSIHGIIDNTFYDPEFKDVFSLGRPAARNGSWWDAEPIWTTLNKQGKKSATFFWPGSDAGAGSYPDYWFSYNGSIPYSYRVNQTIEWIELPSEERPAWISLYFDEPDRQAHKTGPDTDKVDEQIKRVDEQVYSLIEGLSKRNLLHCINILIVADHGMVASKKGREIDPRELAPKITEVAHVFGGASARINTKQKNEELVYELLSNLSCSREGLRAYHKTDLPLRLHYTNSDRIDPIVLDLDPGYSIKDVRPGKEGKKPPHGQHGYDYYYTEMNALFLGYGPDLLQGKIVPPFQNIELYNVICDLVGVIPAPNNGTRGVLNILTNPLPLTQDPIKVLPSLTLSEEVNTGVTQCQDNKWSFEDWSSVLGVTKNERDEWEKQHLPWGAPTPTQNTPLHNQPPSLLHHNTHITGYSQELKSPLWTSFSLAPPTSSSSRRATTTATPVSAMVPDGWVSDPRLGSINTPACSAITDLPPNITVIPLFPRLYVNGESKANGDIYRLISNAGVMNEGMVTRWRQLSEVLLPRWLGTQGPINVVLGPVYDHDKDGHPDMINNGSYTTPSDYFGVVTACEDTVKSIGLCPTHKIRSIAFVYPLSYHPWTCASAEEYARMYSARVRDVEIVTGLQFFTYIKLPHRSLITTAIHSNLWQ